MTAAAYHVRDPKCEVLQLTPGQVQSCPLETHHRNANWLVAVWRVIQSVVRTKSLWLESLETWKAQVAALAKQKHTNFKPNRAKLCANTTISRANPWFFPPHQQLQPAKAWPGPGEKALEGSCNERLIYYEAGEYIFIGIQLNRNKFIRMFWFLWWWMARRLKQFIDWFWGEAKKWERTRERERANWWRREIYAECSVGRARFSWENVDVGQLDLGHLTFEFHLIFWNFWN